MYLAQLVGRKNSRVVFFTQISPKILSNCSKIHLDRQTFFNKATKNEISIESYRKFQTKRFQRLIHHQLYITNRLRVLQKGLAIRS